MILSEAKQLSLQFYNSRKSQRTFENGVVASSGAGGPPQSKNDAARSVSPLLAEENAQFPMLVSTVVPALLLRPTQSLHRSNFPAAESARAVRSLPQPSHW